MAISLYDASVASFLQLLGGIANVLDKGAQFAREQNLDLQEIVNYRMREDMAPFSFQVLSVRHHSLGAVEGLRAGVFQPPPKLGDIDYAGLQGLVGEAVEGLQAVAREDLEGREQDPMIFKVGSREIPFTAADFILSFSLPNFYFHATTTYAVLRMHGVPLGKLDYLGALRTTA